MKMWGFEAKKGQKVHPNFAPNITMEFHYHAFCTADCSSAYLGVLGAGFGALSASFGKKKKKRIGKSILGNFDGQGKFFLDYQ